MSGNEWCLTLTKRIHWAINITWVIVYLHRTQYIYNLINVELLLFTAQFKQMLKMSSTWINAGMAHLIMDCRTFSKAPVWLRIVWQVSKMLGWSVSSFSFWAEYTMVFKCSHRQNSKGLRSGERGVCTSKIKCLRTYINVNFYPCLDKCGCWCYWTFCLMASSS